MIRAIVMAFLVLSLATAACAAPTRIVSMTTPVARGHRVGVSAITIAGSHCNIEVIDASGHPALYPSLQAKTADAQGFVRWAFTLRADASVGTYRVTIRTSTPGVGKASARVNFVVLP